MSIAILELGDSADTNGTVNGTVLVTNDNSTTDHLANAGGLSKAQQISLLFTLITGGIGCLANGTVLIALVADKKLRKYSSMFLIKYQVGLDFVACVLLVVSYALKVGLDENADRTRRWGNVVCMLFVGDGLVTIAMYAAAANLAMIALERYVKIVHSVKHRNYFRKQVLFLYSYF